MNSTQEERVKIGELFACKKLSHFQEYELSQFRVTAVQLTTAQSGLRLLGPSYNRE